jgi:hypothetical protein
VAPEPVLGDGGSPAQPADLAAELTRAYLSGDGAEVERVMALMAAAQAPPNARGRRPRLAA